MKFKISFFTSETILLFVIAKVMHAAEATDPCPSELEHIVADMCTEDSAIEDSVDGSKAIASVLLRITKQRNNCLCHVSLQNNATNYTIYMSKYEGLSKSAPEQQNCGLAVDVEYVDRSDTTRSLKSIECTDGTSMRSIGLEGSELKLKSKIIDGDFTRGYCMQISRDLAIYTCKMNAQIGKSGRDDEWIQSPHLSKSIDECERYCLRTEACGSVHYESNICFVYNKTTPLLSKDNAIYSQKQCFDNQKLKIKCRPPESTTQTSQESTKEDTFSTKFITETKPIGDNHSKSYNPQSTIERGKTIIKDTSTSFLVALVFAVIGCTVAVFFAGTTVFYKRQLHIQKRKVPFASSLNYVDLSGARDVSNYSTINTQAMNEQQYEIVNERT